MRLSDNNVFGPIKFEDSLASSGIKSGVFHYELYNVGLEAQLRTIRLSRDGSRTIRVRLPQFIIVSQTLISDGGVKKFFLLDIVNESVWFDGVVTNEVLASNPSVPCKTGIEPILL